MRPAHGEKIEIISQLTVTSEVQYLALLFHKQTIILKPEPDKDMISLCGEFQH